MQKVTAFGWGLDGAPLGPPAWQDGEVVIRVRPFFEGKGISKGDEFARQPGGETADKGVRPPQLGNVNDLETGEL